MIRYVILAIVLVVGGYIVNWLYNSEPVHVPYSIEWIRARSEPEEEEEEMN